METLKNQTQTFFLRETVTGDGKKKNNLDKNIQSYNKTGKFGLAGTSFTFGGAIHPHEEKSATQPVSPKI